MIIIANAKKVKMLELVRPYINTLQYRLYKNDYNPAGTMTLQSFVEVTDLGYSRRAPGGFGPSVFNATAGLAETKADQWITVFNFNHGVFTVYGYYVVDPADNTVVYAERANPPFQVENAQDCFTVVPKLSGGTLAV